MIDRNGGDIITNQFGICFRKVMDLLHIIRTNQKSTSSICSKPLTITSINSYTVDTDTTKQIIRITRTIVTRYFDLLEGNTLLPYF